MSLHVETTGSGDPLLLVHGWGMHGGVWGDVAQKLAADFQVHCVDLPGYGYARVSKAAQEKFADIITGFLLKRPVIRRVFVLIDSRHEPHQIDLEFVSWLAGCGVPYVLVFTKIDKLKIVELPCYFKYTVGTLQIDIAFHKE